jgi:hypothetical protein
VQWVKQEGSYNAGDELFATETDKDGNLYLCGRFNSDDTQIGGTTLTKGAAQGHGFIAKYNPTGQLAWVHKPNYLGTSKASFYDMAVDYWGNVYAYANIPGTGNVLEVNGTTYSSQNNNTFSFMLAYAPTGTIRWVDQGRQWRLGGTGFLNTPEFKRISTDNSGGLYFHGRSSNTIQNNFTQIGNLPTFSNSARSPFRAKLLDCDAVQATVVSPLTGSLTICDNAPPVQLQAKVTSGGELTYQWQRNNVNITGATASTYSTLQTGAYRVIVSNFNGCVDTSAAVTLSIVSQPLPTATVTAPTVTEVCAGGSVQLQANIGTILLPLVLNALARRRNQGYALVLANGGWSGSGNKRGWRFVYGYGHWC